VQLNIRVPVTTVAAVVRQHVPIHIKASDVHANQDTQVMDVPAQVRIN